MAKKISGYIKLQVPAGKANPSPPIGPALGQRGLNIMEFCKAFNAATQGMEPGMPIPTVITAYADRTFTFATKTPPASFFLRRRLAWRRVTDTRQERRRQGHRGAVPRDRRDQDEGSQRQRPRPATTMRARPGAWASTWWRADPMAKLSKRLKAAAGPFTGQAVPARRGGGALKG